MYSAVLGLENTVYWPLEFSCARNLILHAFNVRWNPLVFVDHALDLRAQELDLFLHSLKRTMVEPCWTFGLLDCSRVQVSHVKQILNKTWNGNHGLTLTPDPKMEIFQRSPVFHRPLSFIAGCRTAPPAGYSSTDIQCQTQRSESWTPLVILLEKSSFVVFF